jgi:glycerate 2-kinase
MTQAQSLRSLADQAIEIWQAGVDAVRADRLVADNVFIDDECIDIGDLSIDRADVERVLLVGAGKATASMARSLQRLFEPYVPVYGWVNVPEGTDTQHIESKQNPHELIVFAARPSGINEPTQAVIKGTEQILNLSLAASPKDLVLAVLSGGGSALLAAPIPGISLEDKIAVTRHLSSSGADICELNTVRKQLSLVKGGGLANACRGRRLITLVLSDVLGDPLDVIASGPTVANRTCATDAKKVLARYDPRRTLPATIYEALDRRQREQEKDIIPDTMDDGAVVVLGNNATAVDAAGIRAESLGYSHAMTVARSSEGSAESVGFQLAEMAVSMLRDRDSGHESPNCLITGGEPTVKLAPPNIRGRGGRNTHVVLAAMQRLYEMQLDQETLDRISILSGGTDGEDGPTDAAGAVLCKRVWRNAARLKLEPADFLARSDSYTFFQSTDGLLITGPTHTNVCDVRVVLIR